MIWRAVWESTLASSDNLSICVEAPSNIALLKYWGKSDATLQWPANDSLSLSLNLHTTTTVRQAAPNTFVVTDHRGQGGACYAKPQSFLRSLAAQLSFTGGLSIQTTNQFPMACGIASSASGLAALTIAALACWTASHSFAELADHGFDRERISALARLGSGSACRSLFPGFVHWQRGRSASDQRVYRLSPPDDWSLRDCIVFLQRTPKRVSSTAGHELAWSSPLFKKRLELIPQRLAAMLAAIDAGDFDVLGPLIEEDSLEMHAVVASSQPPLRYMIDATEHFLSAFRSLRRREHLSAYFTIDAGPNVHIIYLAKERERLLRALQGYDLLDTGTGFGPRIKTSV